ncbi:monocarboxylate permease-like protein [Dissoconium aciculare CBS 342.82]|uniref:Monocarboxylate permease-like protein n=1 Tax=Dissoconium aciculare CBS 342.82 TaxID=1314786 RepID=A0A6J3LVD9_9PEZI|nr:monocarboxylate permease-like protein [Dissoconium aciculare CBS 342.82]KAF1818587.1 monocarboxylate permease-like protein [Dissoconium aciculare CBS 342.82]
MPSSRTPEKSVRPAPTCEHLHDSASAAPSDKPDEPSPLKSGKLEHEETHLDTAPDGGARAWLVAAGGSAIFFCCLGFSNSFGTFEEYYLSHQLQDKSPSDIAWIGSLSSFLQFAAGMVGGPLFDFFGSWIIIPSAILYVFALMMLSLCDQYWQIMLVQGVLMGIVMGLLQFPAFAAVSQYFDKKRAAALGVVVSGSSIGGVIIPIVLSELLNSSSLGFGWSVRIVGFLILPFMIFAVATVRARLPPRKSSFWIPSAYKNKTYMLLIAVLFFMFIGMFTPLFYLPTYAVSRGMNPTLAGYLLAILNAASTFGRIIPGVLADKYGRLNMFALGGIVSGVIIFFMNSVTDNAGLIVYAAFFGFASGTIISGASAAFSTCTSDPRDIGTYMGMGMSISALGGLIGPPINGVMVDRYQSFFQVAMLSGTLCVVGGIIAALTKLTTKQGMLGRA